MRIRNKLIFLFTALVSVLLLAFSMVIYFSFPGDKRLLYVLAICFIVTIALFFLAARFVVKRTGKPISDIIKRVEEITATDLKLRVEINTQDDEVSALVTTFNIMLNRLEKSFDAQKEFVSNIAHELRTPLTAMLAELQLSLSNERSNEAYKTSIRQAINDAQKLVRLSTGLLDLAKANYDHAEITFKDVRLDEVLLDARNDILHKHPDYKVNLIIFDGELEEEDFVTVKGNEYLLKIAFINLIENGCKFSDNKTIDVGVTYYQDKTILRFSDAGIGIDTKELPLIFTFFYRGENKNYAEGTGIGLSLTKKIIDLHNGSISIASKVKEGTTFTIELTHV